MVNDDPTRSAPASDPTRSDPDRATTAAGPASSDPDRAADAGFAADRAHALRTLFPASGSGRRLRPAASPVAASARDPLPASAADTASTPAGRPGDDARRDSTGGPAAAGAPAPPDPAVPAAARRRRRLLLLTAMLVIVSAAGAVALWIPTRDQAEAGSPTAGTPTAGPAPAGVMPTGNRLPTAEPSAATTSATASPEGSSPSASAPPTTTPPTPTITSPAATSAAAAAPARGGRPNPDGRNLALRRPATASSEEGEHFAAPAAVDGDLDTRWSSGFSDPQWIRIDLGQVWQLSSVTLVWERSYGTAYRVETSTDGRTWSTRYSTNAGTGGRVRLELPGTDARYLRMYGTRRHTEYGYSLLEIEVR